MAQATVQIKGAVSTIQLEPKQFKTGSVGYHGNGKVSTQEGKYQVNIIVVKIGSKKE